MSKENFAMFAYMLAEEMAVVGNMIESRNHL